MRLISIDIKGVTAFASPATVDFGSIGNGIVAVVGRNGAGKTTLMEAVPAALYRSMPTKPGAIYDYCAGKDAYIECAFEMPDGRVMRVRFVIDAVARKSESYVFIGDECITDGKKNSFAGVIQDHFGSQEVFLASVFATQTKAGNLIHLSRAQRKDVFAELLGLGRIQALSERAGERARAAEAEVKVAIALSRAAAERAKDCSRLQEALDDINQEERDAREAVFVASADLEELRARFAGFEPFLVQRTSLREQIAEAARSMEREVAFIASEKSAYEAQRKTCETKRNSLKNWNYEERHADLDRKHELTLNGLMARLEEKQREVEQLRVSFDYSSVEKHESELKRLAEERETLRKYGEEYSERNSQLSAKRALLEAARERLKTYQQTLDTRIADLNGSLGHPQCGIGSDLAEACELAAGMRETRAKIAELEAARGPRVESLAEAVSALEADIAALEAQPSRHDPERASQIAKTEAELNDSLRRVMRANILRSEISGIEAGMADIDARYEEDANALLEQNEQMVRDAAVLEDEWTRINESINACVARRATVVMEADLRVAGLKENLEQIEESLRERDEIGTKIEALSRSLPVLTETAAKARERQAAARAEVDAARAAHDEMVAARAKEETASREAREWTILQEALGKNGIQALAIDAAGPKVSSIANDLLAACEWGRFSLSIETLREKQRGEGMIEVFDINVYDGGAQRPIESLSGGEKVVVGEALSLAVAIFNARQWGVSWKTLWRDETAGALDTENAKAYVSMLRRARELGGFAQVIFVAHQPEVYNAADASVVIDRGRVVE